MPPKKNQKGESMGERDLQQVEERGRALKVKKSVEEEGRSEELGYLNALGNCIDEESSAETVSVKRMTQRQRFFNANLNEDKFEDDSSTDAVLACQDECMVCLESDFTCGKYILQCHHTFCNECFIYWSLLPSLSTNCPACHKQTNSTLMLLQGEYRVSEIKPKRVRQASCEVCGNGHNEGQMYYCDECEKGCVHVYCQKDLIEGEDSEEEWFCRDCKEREKKDGRKLRKGRKKTKMGRAKRLRKEDKEYYTIGNFIDDHQDMAPCGLANRRNSTRSRFNASRDSKDLSSSHPPPPPPPPPKPRRRL